MTTFSHLAAESFGGNVIWVRVEVATTALSAGNAGATEALDAIAAVMHRMAQPAVVGAPYARGTGSAVIFAMPATLAGEGLSALATALQTAVRATAPTSLDAATVTVTENLVG